MLLITIDILKHLNELFATFQFNELLNEMK